MADQDILVSCICPKTGEEWSCQIPSWPCVGEYIKKPDAIDGSLPVYQVCSVLPQTVTSAEVFLVPQWD